MKNSLFYKIIKKIGWHYIFLKDDIYDLVYEYRYEKKLNIKTIGDTAGKQDKSVNGDETAYIPSSYRDVAAVLYNLDLKRNDVLVDLGCGKGRVPFLASTYEINKAIGIELRESLYQQAKENQERLTNKKSVVEIFHGDVVNFNYDEITAVYMYNPFGLKTLKQVMDKIYASIQNNPRSVKIAYYRGPEDCRSYLDGLTWLSRIPLKKPIRTKLAIYASQLN